MDHKIVIFYQNASAYYHVSEDSEGIFTLELTAYEGGRDKAPCSSLTIIKGVSRWFGCGDKELLNLLAEAIRSVIEAPILLPDNKPE